MGGSGGSYSRVLGVGLRLMDDETHILCDNGCCLLAVMLVPGAGKLCAMCASELISTVQAHRDALEEKLSKIEARLMACECEQDWNCGCARDAIALCGE